MNVGRLDKSILIETVHINFKLFLAIFVSLHHHDHPRIQTPNNHAYNHAQGRRHTWLKLIGPDGI